MRPRSKRRWLAVGVVLLFLIAIALTTIFTRTTGTNRAHARGIEMLQRQKQLPYGRCSLCSTVGRLLPQ
jgi:hypothetical protein